MNSPSPLNANTREELRAMAKSRKILGWHEMRKAELIAALERVGREKTARKAPESAPAKAKTRKEPNASPTKTSGGTSKPLPGKKVSAGKQTASEKGASSKKQPVPEKKAARSKSESVGKAAKTPVVKGTPPKAHVPVSSAADKKTPPKTPSQATTKSTAKPTPAKLTLVSEPTPAATRSPKTPKPQKSPKPASKLSVFPDAEAERAGSEPASKKGEKILKKPEGEEIREIEKIETARSTQDRQRANFLKEKLLLQKTLETPSTSGRPVQDRLVLLVCGPFWLHTWWEISGTLITRIRAAMGHLWHTADPVLRLYRVWADSAGLIRREYLSDIAIHGGVYNWYLSVDDPPGSFLVEIGYKARDGRFFSLVSSNIVETPQSYVHDGVGLPETNWRGPAAPFAPEYSPYDRRTQDGPGTLPSRPAPPSDEDTLPFEENGARLSDAAIYPIGRGNRDFDLRVDAEVVIKGKTSPDVQLTIKGERVWLKEDGSFLIRYHLPERRHVFPVVAVSRDGIETKTVVLAVERNTKNLETVIRDQSDEE